MSYEEAITKLNNLYLIADSDEEKQALGIAIITLKEVSRNTKARIILCPYCGKTYEWNNCHWR